jgi:hypothetical protein
MVVWLANIIRSALLSQKHNTFIKAELAICNQSPLSANIVMVCFKQQFDRNLTTDYSIEPKHILESIIDRAPHDAHGEIKGCTGGAAEKHTLRASKIGVKIFYSGASIVDKNDFDTGTDRPTGACLINLFKSNCIAANVAKGVRANISNRHANH